MRVQVKVVRARVPESLSRALASLASTHGLTPSAMLRQLLSEGLERRELWPVRPRAAAVPARARVGESPRVG